MENCNGGVIVNSQVTKSGRINFFMQSQRVTRGTGTFTHYDIRRNEMGLSEE